MSNTMRAKVTVDLVTVITEGSVEEVVFRPVPKLSGYDSDGADEDNTFAKFTPSGRLQLTITNPDLLGTFKVGDQFYVDFSPVPVSDPEPDPEPEEE